MKRSNYAQGNFRLDVETGEFTDSEIIVMLGENGTGKTTFIRMLHGTLAPDDAESADKIPQFNVSYKPQKISPKFPGSVRLDRQRTHLILCWQHISLMQQSQSIIRRFLLHADQVRHITVCS